MNLDNHTTESQENNNIKLSLENLSKEISNEFGLNQENSKLLVESSEIDSLGELEARLNIFETKGENIISKKAESLEKLLSKLKEARNVIEKNKLYISKFKSEIQNSLEISENTKNENTRSSYISFVERNLPQKMVNLFKNPKNIHEHLGGFCLGLANSGEACLKLGKDVIFGIAKTPSDIYAIAKGDAVYERNV